MSDNKAGPMVIEPIRITAASDVSINYEPIQKLILISVSGKVWESGATAPTNVVREVQIEMSASTGMSLMMILDALHAHYGIELPNGWPETVKPN